MKICGNSIQDLFCIVWVLNFFLLIALDATSSFSSCIVYIAKTFSWQSYYERLIYKLLIIQILLLHLNWQFLSSPCRQVPQRLLQLWEWGSGRQPCCVAVHPSPIYLTYGGDAGSPSLLSAGVKTPLQAGKPKPHPSLGPDRNQEEELQTCAHETQHQVQKTRS